MKKLLVPTDFSPTSIKALNYAISLAKTAKAEIILLHVCELIHDPFMDKRPYFDHQNSSKVADLRKRLNAYKESIEDIEKIPVRTELYEGEITASIMEVIQESHPDFIIMGTLGNAKLKNKIFGSNTASVVSESSVPVITIPFEYEWQEPKRILLALNNVDEDAATLAPVFALADLFNAEVKAAIFTKSNEYALDVLEDTRTIYGIRENLSHTYNRSLGDIVHLAGDHFQDAVQEYIEMNGINLLAMVSHKAHRPLPLFHRSITKQMSYHTNVPLLSINAPA